MNKPNDRPAEDCGYRTGPLPACGSLALAYVPDQQEADPRYEPPQALARGTLFPGLDLPWMNVSNAAPAEFSGTPLGELMALGFVVNELGLYLDTHAEDAEALKLYTEYVQLLRQGRETFVRRYGPLTQTQVTQEGGYTWLNEPWPWEYASRRDERGRSDD